MHQGSKIFILIFRGQMLPGSCPAILRFQINKLQRADTMQEC